MLDIVHFTPPPKVLAAAEKLKPKQLSGPDGYPALLFKTCAPELSEPLSLLFASFMSGGKVPSAWSHALITAVYKGDCAPDISVYRPISVTSIVCKLIWRVIARDILDYLYEHIISKQQHGFVAK